MRYTLEEMSSNPSRSHLIFETFSPDSLRLWSIGNRLIVATLIGNFFLNFLNYSFDSTWRILPSRALRIKITCITDVSLTLNAWTSYLSRLPVDSLRLWRIGYHLIVATVIGNYFFISSLFKIKILTPRDEFNTLGR